MTAHLRDVDRSRLARNGLVAMPCEEGMSLFDAAQALGEATVVPARIDLTAPRALGEGMPSLLRSLVQLPQGRATVQEAESRPLPDRPAGLGGPERDELLADLICREAAAVLGHGNEVAVDRGRPFRDLGFDSISAVELRNRLCDATGLRLPPGLVFQHPTLDELVRHLRSELDADMPR